MANAAWRHPSSVYRDSRDGFAPDGAVIVRFSNMRDERFATLPDALARQKELSRV